MARNARLEHGQLRFQAPGDDRYGGKVDHYTVRFLKRNGSVETKTVSPTGGAGSVQKVNLVPKTRMVRVRAVDEAGNVGAWELVRH